MIVYNTQKIGESSQLVIQLMEDSIYIEPSAISYILGDIKLDANRGTLLNKSQAYFIGRDYWKPAYTGTGKIFLKATQGCYQELNVEENNPLLVDQHAFIACRDDLNIQPLFNFSLTNFLSGVPTINMQISGKGKVVMLLPGTLVELRLHADKFVAYTSNVCAYSQSIRLTREPAATGWMSVAGRIVDIYRGTGSIYFSPFPIKELK